MGSELSFFFWCFPLTTFRERELEKILRNLNLPFCVAESGFLRWPTCRPPAKIWCSACASRSCGWVQTGAQGVSRRPDPSRRRRSPRRFTMPDCRLFGNTNLRTRAGTTSFQLQARLWDNMHSFPHLVPHMQMGTHLFCCYLAVLTVVVEIDTWLIW